MRLIVTNPGTTEAVVMVDPGDEPGRSDERPPYSFVLLAGESREVRASQFGHVYCDFPAKITVAVKNPSRATREGPVSAGKESS